GVDLSLGGEEEVVAGEMAVVAAGVGGDVDAAVDDAAALLGGQPLHQDVAAPLMGGVVHGEVVVHVLARVGGEGAAGGEAGAGLVEADVEAVADAGALPGHRFA